MSCKLEKNSKGKITNVLDASNKPSTLFKQILNVPTLPLEQAINTYKNVYSEQLKDKVRFQKSSAENNNTRFSVGKEKTAGEINQELIDKLKQNGLSEEVFLMSTQEIDAKLKELGVSDDVRKQVADYVKGYYSNANVAFSNLKDKNVKNVQGWMKALTDVQKNGGIKNVNQELEWIGLEDYLNEYVKENNPKAGNIPSSVVEDYIKSNQIEIVEVSKGGDLKPVPLAFNKLNEFDEDDYGSTISSYETIEEVYEDDEVGYQIVKTDEGYYVRDERTDNVYRDDNYENSLFSTFEEAVIIAGLHLADKNKTSTEGTKYEGYQLKGGENYREVLLTMPSKEGKNPLHTKRDQLSKQYREAFDSGNYDLANEIDNQISDITKQLKAENSLNTTGEKAQYKSSHWSEANILAHVRLNEKTLPDGRRVLIVNEIQSDWAQDGRKKGFTKKQPFSQEEFDNIVDKRNEIFSKNVFSKITVREFDDRNEYKRQRNLLKEEFEKSEEYLEYSRLNKLVEEFIESKDSNKITQMPYTNTDQWVGLVTRRVMQMASQEGYDGIAFATGQQSADMYSLSQQVDKININPQGDIKAVYISMKNSGDDTVFINQEGVITESASGAYNGKQAEEVLGKDLTRKILETNEETTLEGEGLEFGGEGMKTFYDKIVPKVVQKEAQRFDKNVKLGTVDFSEKTNVDITEEDGGFILKVDNKFVEYVDKETLLNANLENTKEGAKKYFEKYIPQEINADKLSLGVQPYLPLTQSIKDSVSQGIPQFQKALSQVGIDMIVNGFVYKNQVFLNKDTADDSVLLHEYNHLFNSWLKENRTELYEKGIDLVKAELEKEDSDISDIISYVKTTQPDLKGEAFLEEMLAEITGIRGSELLNSKKKSGIIDWIREAFKEIGKMLGLLEATPEQVSKMSLKDFADASAVQMLKGENFVELYDKASKFNNLEDFIDSMSIFRDAHSAPSKDTTPTEDKLNTGGDFSLEEVAKGFHNQPNDYYTPNVGARYYGYNTTQGMESFTAINNIIRGTKANKGNQTITAYRAVPSGVEINKLKDYDWVTFSKTYAKNHGESRFGEGEYKIVKQEVPITDLWWDGNDINEWGYDTGNTKKYNRKELKDIWNYTKDNEKSFQQLSNIRFQIVGEKGASRIQEYQNLLDQAKELEAKGEDYSQTGWYKGLDGWKYLSKEVIENFKIVNKEENKVLKLKEVLGDENILFTIYPEMQEVSVVFLNENKQGYEKFKPIDKDTAGEFNPSDETIRINIFYQGNERTLEEVQYILGHEVSHYGQRLEGFSRGGNQQTVLQEALDILNIEGEGKFLGQIRKEILEADKPNLTENQLKIVEDSLKTLNALMTYNLNVLMYQYKRLMGEIDANIVGELVTKGTATGTYADLLSMYLNRENIDPESIYYISGNQIQFSLTESITTKVNEPNLSFETPSGETTSSYQEALQKTEKGKIKLNIEDVNVGEVDSDTNLDTFEGTINHLVKSGGLTGIRYIDKNGEVVFETNGKSDTAKQLTANLVEEQVAKLLGQRNIKRLRNGDFILKEGLNKITINGEEFNKKDIDALDFTQLTKKFGRETALRIELMREYSKALQPTKTKKRLEEVEELKTEDELVTSIKSLLNKLGVKITSIEDYIKHNKLKNNDVDPSANALMDVVNKIMAFKNGVITREDLIEETMHLIEATLDPRTTEGIRRNIDKTEEWKQYSEQYFEIYSKEYSGEKLDEMVRREILGKVMANAVINNFTLEENASLTKQSIFSRIKELLQQFFDRVNAYFKPEYQQQIDALNNDIYAKLMSGTLYSEMNLDQNFGTKFRLYSTSNNIANDIVLLQKQAEKALDVLSTDKKTGVNKSAIVKAVRDVLGHSAEKLKNAQEREAKVELIKSFSQIVNMSQRQVNYLETALKKAEANKHPFSAEEMAVYMNLVNQFDANILPTVVETIKKQKILTNAEKKIVERIEKLQKDINVLKGKVGTNGFNAKDYTVRMLVERLGLDAETEKFLQEQVNSTQQEANWFFIQFGNLSHSSNIMLNTLGHVITKKDFDTRQGFMEDIKPFIEKLANLDFLKGTKLSEFVRGNYIQSAHNFEAIETAILDKKYELYQSVIKNRLSDTTLSKEDRDNLQAKIDNLISKEEFAKIEVFDDLDVKTDQEIKRQLDIWQLETFKLSPFYADEYATKREKLGQYSDITQSYIAQRSAEYSSIYEMAETINGKQVVTADMKYRFEQLKKEEVQAKDVFDTEGEFKKGLYLSDSSDPNAIEISKNFFVGIDRAVADDFAKLAFELNQIAKERLELAKSKNQGNEFSQEFEDILRSMNSEEAYEFLTLNAYLTYTQEYYDTFNRESLVDRLESAKDGENDADIDAIIQDIQINTKKINNIIQANKVMNNPSEVNFDGMESSEKTAVKEYSERLDFTYQKARKYLPKTEESEQEESITEVKPNRAFFDYLFDKNPNVFESGIVPDFTEIDILSADDIIKANKVFSEIIEHTTENKKREILDLKREVERFSKGTQTKFNRLHQRVFSITEEDLKMMSEEEIYSILTKDLLKYSYSKLLPYFKKTQPINADIALQDLEAGKITPSEFIDNYKNEKYEYLQISPNFNFQDATEVNNRNPEFEFAKANGTPMYRVFEKGVQESDLVGKSVEQLINEGKINKFIDKEYFEEYGIDLVKLLNGEEVATKNTQKFEARKALVDLQKLSLEKNGVLGSHNLYQLPQKEKSQTRKLDDFFSQGKSLKSLFDELKNFREDDIELGQDNETDKYGRTTANIDNLSVPTYGIRKLKDSPVTDDLLESYVWMNFKANEHKARKDNYQDAFNIGIAAFGDDFGYKTSAEAGNNYKMFKEAMDYNFYGIKETWSYKVKTGIFGEVDVARILQNFGKWIRLRNLGFTLISPITSATTGSVFKRIESLIGENIDKDAEKVANKFFRKHASEASLEILSLESKTVLNSLGELYGWYEPLERYQNTMYSKAVRGLGQSAFAAHQLANFPINTRVGLSVLANHRFFEGKLLEYREYKKLFPGKSDRDIRETWRQQTSVLDVVKLESDGRISYDYSKISESLNNNFTEQEAKEFMDTKNASLIRGRIKSAIQKIDGQISEEDRSMSTRNAFFSFVNIHRSWLFIAVQNKFKKRQFNTQTGYFEEGSWVSTLGYFREFLKASKQKGVINTLSNIRKDFDSYDEVTKRNVKRTLYELAVLNAFVALTAMALRELGDDDDDSYLFKVSSLMLIRTTNELASSSVALHKNVREMLDNVIVGLNSAEIVTQSPDIFSSDIVSRGRFRGMTERERYMFRQLPIMRDYWNIYSDVEGNIKSYNYFNFVKQGNLDYTIYPFFQEEEK